MTQLYPAWPEVSFRIVESGSKPKKSVLFARSTINGQRFAFYVSLKKGQSGNGTDLRDLLRSQFMPYIKQEK